MMTEHPYSSDELKVNPEEPFLKRLWKVISSHWQWKLLCLILAVFLWGIAVSQDTTLTREKLIRDVRISTLNASTLQRNGLIVVSGLEDLQNVSIKVEVPVDRYTTASASNYSVRLDLSSITSPGAQTIPLTAVAATSYGSVTEISRPSVDVMVETYTTRSNIPVRVNRIGNTPEGYYANKAISEIESVTVSGPASVVSQIVRCEVQYTVPESIAEPDTYPTVSPFQFVDIQGTVLDDSLLTVTRDGWGIDSIVVQQTFYPETVLKISDIGLITGTPAEGYEVTGVSYSPATVTVADMNIESHTDDFVYLKGSVDVTGKTGSFTQIVPISRPSGIVYVSTDVVYVTVEIAPVEADQ